MNISNFKTSSLRSNQGLIEFSLFLFQFYTIDKCEKYNTYHTDACKYNCNDINSSERLFYTCNLIY